MSYMHQLEGHVVCFRDELDYISCRKEYLEMERGGISFSFSFFIEQTWRNMHPETIENIQHTGGLVNNSMNTIPAGSMIGFDGGTGVPVGYQEWTSTGGDPTLSWGSIPNPNWGGSLTVDGGSPPPQSWGEATVPMPSYADDGIDINLPLGALPYAEFNYIYKGHKDLDEKVEKIDKKKKKVKKVSRFELMDFED
jgi:hypothetical protein